MTEGPETKCKMVWNALKQPPPHALKTIGGGRLKGKTDISPQWRYEAITKVFGLCGEGWKYQIERLWREEGCDGQIFAFAHVLFYYRQDDPEKLWSEPIPGIGGAMLQAKESGGLYANDEGYKMAVTDALSVALKMIGVASDVYLGLFDGSKYRVPGETTSEPRVKPREQAAAQSASPVPQATPSQQTLTEWAPTAGDLKRLWAAGYKAGHKPDAIKQFVKAKWGVDVEQMRQDQYEAVVLWAEGAAS